MSPPSEKSIGATAERLLCLISTVPDKKPLNEPVNEPVNELAVTALLEMCPPTENLSWLGLNLRPRISFESILSSSTKTIGNSSKSPFELTSIEPVNEPVNEPVVASPPPPPPP